MSVVVVAVTTAVLFAFASVLLVVIEPLNLHPEISESFKSRPYLLSTFPLFDVFVAPD